MCVDNTVTHLTLHINLICFDQGPSAACCYLCLSIFHPTLKTVSLTKAICTICGCAPSLPEWKEHINIPAGIGKSLDFFLRPCERTFFMQMPAAVSCWKTVKILIFWWSHSSVCADEAELKHVAHSLSGCFITQLDWDASRLIMLDCYSVLWKTVLVFAGAVMHLSTCVQQDNSTRPASIIKQFLAACSILPSSPLREVVLNRYFCFMFQSCHALHPSWAWLFIHYLISVLFPLLTRIRDIFH